ncbi:two component system response regulator [Desulfosarcina variabilis str. Montpellier]|uniref:response regulator n=1 Tax=Desulfosarcina variabilis TaxID=2300 RepID=UPI003AFA3F46
MAAISFLLVDDEQALIEVIAQRLRQRGHEVECAFSGQAALDRLELGGIFDVVVLDVIMPGLDGIQTVKRIKKKHPLMEVIMLTGHATVQTAVETVKHGAMDYLQKPCDIEDLLAKAQKAAQRKKEREAKLFEARTKPYISERERSDLISKILEQ